MENIFVILTFICSTFASAEIVAVTNFETFPQDCKRIEAGTEIARRAKITKPNKMVQQEKTETWLMVSRVIDESTNISGYSAGQTQIMGW